MASIVKFVNWTKEDFSHPWNKENYDFPAGSSIFMEDWKAAHFAKHLTDREVNRIMDKETDEKKKNYGDTALRKELYARCFSENKPSSDDVSKTETEIVNLNKTETRFCQSCDSKGVRHKKGCPTRTLKPATA